MSPSHSVPSATTRKLALACVHLFVVGALVYYVLDEPRWGSIGMALLLIVAFAPIKGLLYRRLGGVRPYFSALVANAASQFGGLPFHFDISFWWHIFLSFVASGFIESFVLVGLNTAPTMKKSLIYAFYGSLVVHLLSAGYLALRRYPAVGVPVLILGIVLVHLPAFFPEED